MLNVTKIKNASIAQLREFCQANEIVIEGDKRVKATFEKAIAQWQQLKKAAKEIAVETVEGAIECVKEAVTYDNVVIAANWVGVWSRKSLSIALRVMWSLFLVSVAIGYFAYRLWCDRVEVKSAIVQSYQGLIEKARSTAKEVKQQYLFLQMVGRGVIYLRVETPAKELSDRMMRVVQ